VLQIPPTLLLPLLLPLPPPAREQVVHIHKKMIHYAPIRQHCLNAIQSVVLTYGSFIKLALTPAPPQTQQPNATQRKTCAVQITT
jgi:hypothetical protein